LIVDTLENGDWKSKKDIVEAAKIKDTEWRTAIKTLMEKDIVECNFSKHARKRASNRKYMYRLVPA
jgi:transcription initiation factor IIE alpha subunit